MQTIWDNRALRENALEILAKGVEVSPGHSPKKHKDVVSSLLDFVRALPHTVQMGVKTPESYFWGNLAEASLITSSTDLLLKNGGQLPGDWTVLGILDAFPGNDEAPKDEPSTISELGALGAIAALFAPNIMKAVGRPERAYGLTPILIFREAYGVSAS